MKTPLDALLEAIDPVRTYEENERRVSCAMNAFPYPEGPIHDWNAFTKVMARFFRHVEDRILRVQGKFAGDPDMDWGRCNLLLNALYGAQGDKAAFERVRTGHEGGLYAVLTDLGAHMAKAYARREVIARVGLYWESLSAPEQLNAAEQYVQKWGHLLPSELVEGNAVRIKAAFPHVLELHVEALLQLRRATR